MRAMDMTRFMIDAAVGKAIGDIARDPDRSIRNLVDLGMNFSKGRFQRRFIGTIQGMLNHPRSPYYQVAKHAVSDINHNALKTFGVNMGYNSFTRGAKTIRSLEASTGVNIPWSIAIHYSTTQGALTAEDVGRTIVSAKGLGIYTFIIYCTQDSVASIQPLLGKHNDCAFILMLAPGLSQPHAVAELARFTNLLTLVSTDDPSFDDAMSTLKAEKAFCAPYWQYDEKGAADILSDAWVKRVLPYQCVFGFLIAGQDCPEAVQARVSQHIYDVRQSQRFPIVLIDYFADWLAIDEVISDEPCFMLIDAMGEVYRCDPMTRTNENITRSELPDVIRRVMPRVAGR